MKQKHRPAQILIPVFFTAAILALVIYQWNVQMIDWQGSSSPLFRNLMDYNAYIKQGFNPEEIRHLELDETWHIFESTQLRIKNSPLSNLPKRSFLYPWALQEDEYTILIPIELDRTALESRAEPGIFLGYIGENWEVYFNGHLVQREMHLDEQGRITNRRNWRSVHFSMDNSILQEGINTLAFRIIGDPSYGVTGLYYSSPYYLDDYSLIRRRHTDILTMVLCGIFGYTGIYYLIIFVSVRKKDELYNLYYSIASVLLCIYTFMFSGMVNQIIPNSDISIRLEYISLFMLVPVLGLFIEHFGMQRITKITWGFLVFYGILSITQIFFSNQYGDDVLMIWSATVLIYFSYIFFYNVVNFYLRKKRKEYVDPFVGNILIGLVVVYLCGLYDVLDIIFFHTSSSLFLYSTFIFHIGMAITLSQRYREMYSQLEQSNILLEEKVTERTIELIEASKAKSNFLANMSHEIRTPLNAVIGFSEIELRSHYDGNELPEATRENITHIHRSGSLLLEIINEILDISKIESGRLDLYPNEYETAPLISGTISLNRVRIGEKPIQFILDIKENFPARLIGDELRIRQILNNLLSNAIKYTEHGSVKLAIESEETEKGKVSVCFTVSDTGIGIRPDDIEKLFEKYSQLDGGTTRKNEGTGLGLTITKNLAEMMGGTILVESEYGKGSVFKAYIIQERDSIEAIGRNCANALQSFQYDIQYKTKKINPINIPEARVLVVDDIAENLLVVRGFLQSYGLHIDTASGGREAIDLIKQNKYNLIFMDHMMPEMDGVQTLKAIRELELECVEFAKAIIEDDSKTPKQSVLPSVVPIVVLTSNALRGMNEFYLEHGFQDFLSKPVNPQELDEVLRKWLTKEEFSAKAEPSSFAVNISSELYSRRLDELKHYCFRFENTNEIDSEYLQRFTAFTEVLGHDKLFENEDLNTYLSALTEAGRKEDIDAIRKILPDVYIAMEKHSASDSPDIKEMVESIKEALLKDDEEGAKKIRKTMGSIKLSPEDRELYFTLYEAAMSDDKEQALKTIDTYLLNRNKAHQEE